MMDVTQRFRTTTRRTQTELKREKNTQVLRSDITRRSRLTVSFAKRSPAARRVESPGWFTEAEQLQLQDKRQSVKQVPSTRVCRVGADKQAGLISGSSSQRGSVLR